LWSPYLRCSPQMLRMRLPVWLMRLPLRLHSLLPWRFPLPDLLMSAPVQITSPVREMDYPDVG
ncbi:hypothetical protein DRD22_16745, partial [Salmonella enterica subsp. enterica serovar Newport]|nr:hypothetical protein [Salmonella enterica subsp. enterica serovar Newport]EBX1852328.1 hypothetical protein [Salmonella enterica subsp. enterica serovar Newport]